MKTISAFASGFLVCAALVAGFGAGRATQDPQDLVVKSLKVVDDKGGIRASFTTLNESTFFSLSNGNGKGITSFQVVADGSSQLSLLSPVGKGSVFLESDAKGDGRVLLMGDKKSNQLFLASRPSGSADIAMYTNDGHARLAARLDEHGPCFGLSDKAGVIRAVLGTIVLDSPNGVKATYPENTLTFLGPDGKLLRQIP